MKTIQVNYIPANAAMIAKALGMTPEKFVCCAINYLFGQYVAVGIYDLEEFLTHDEEAGELIAIYEELNKDVVKKPEPTTLKERAAAIIDNFIEAADREGYDKGLYHDLSSRIFAVFDILVNNHESTIRSAKRHYTRFEWRAEASGGCYIVYYDSEGIRSPDARVKEITRLALDDCKSE